MQRFALLLAVLLVLPGNSPTASNQPAPPAHDPTAFALAEIDAMDVEPGDWPQFGGTSHRNNTPHGENIPTDWDVETGRNILWSAELGSQSYGSPVIANGKVYIGTNNGHGYLERYPDDVDVSCFVCFDALTGDFLWQHSSLKLATGRVHDWPDQGISSTPYCDGDRLWFVTTRGCVCCLDAEGFRDGENDGPFITEEGTNLNDADVVWEFDMMGELGVRQHQQCNGSCTAAGDYLIVSTSNGVDESHINIPAPNAPSLIVMHKHTSEILWTDNSAGTNIIEGQWSSPACGVLGGVPQVIFGGPDGWLYSFALEGNGNGRSALLWKFDGNHKDSKHILGGRGNRNYFVATPVIYDGLVYVAMGQSPEFGEGTADFWCIDPTRRGDVSPTLAVDAMLAEIPHRRVQAVDAKAGERAVDNPNSALVWHYRESDLNGDGAIDWDEEMHRTCATPVIKNNLVVFPDFSGLLHCLDAKTGQTYWNYDMFSASWGSALIVENRIYAPDEEGDVAIFELSREMRVISETDMENSVFSTPCVANDILYIANKNTLFAIANPR
jgi:outer membrane protein assembly factor BamB